jgi:hypothetical protein
MALKLNHSNGYQDFSPSIHAPGGHTFPIDCNSGFAIDDLPMFEPVDKLGLALIEQPLAHDD